MNRKILAALIAIVLIAGAYWAYNSIEENSASEDSDVSQDVEKTTEDSDLPAETEDEDEIQYQFMGQLEDVLDTETAAERRGLVSNGLATGVAKYAYIDGTYSLSVTFENLPIPNGDDFYEGWIVRKEPFDFVSTGALEIVDGEYIDTYTSSVDYSEYSTYILTIEPNDDDPAPARHVLEGDMDQEI